MTGTTYTLKRLKEALCKKEGIYGSKIWIYIFVNIKIYKKI